jgi:hypothetical protein
VRRSPSEQVEYPEAAPRAEDADRASFYRYGVVLLLLTASFTFAMVSPPGAWPHLVSAILEGAAVLVALFRANADRRLLLVGLVAVTVTVAAAAADVAGGEPWLGGVADLAVAGVLVLVPAAIVMEFRRNLTVTIQSILAALCIYVVLGMFFASVAAAVAGISGSPYFAGHTTANSADYTYFSFITLATIGYGDYVPVLRLGRALAVLEGLMGQLYLVTVVGLVVGNLGRGRR